MPSSSTISASPASRSAAYRMPSRHCSRIRPGSRMRTVRWISLSGLRAIWLLQVCTPIEFASLRIDSFQPLHLLFSSDTAQPARSNRRTVGAARRSGVLSTRLVRDRKAHGRKSSHSYQIQTNFPCSSSKRKMECRTTRTSVGLETGIGQQHPPRYRPRQCASCRQAAKTGNHHVVCGSASQLWSPQASPLAELAGGCPQSDRFSCRFSLQVPPVPRQK